MRHIDFRRMRFALAATLLAGSPLAAQTGASKPEITASTVVFVCEHGSAKSVIAAAHFNRLARERGLSYRAVSRGTKPGEAVAPAVQTGLASDGIDVSTWRPRAVTDQEIRRAGKVISLATDLPATKPFAKSKLLEWNDIPPVSESYDAARSAILERIEKLVDSLAPGPKN